MHRPNQDIVPTPRIEVGVKSSVSVQVIRQSDMLVFVGPMQYFVTPMSEYWLLKSKARKQGVHNEM